MVHGRLLMGIATASLLAATGCGERSTPQHNQMAQEPVAETSPVPLPEPRLGREQLVLAALRALSAAAVGQNDAEAQKPLKGRAFELRLRFGCPGMVENGSRTWSYDADGKVLRAHVGTDLGAQKVPASDLLLKGYEGIAGFVVEQPLLLAAGCPAPQFTAATAGGPTIAVAQLFTDEDSRVQRPKGAYELTKPLEADAAPKAGLDLVVAGRLAPLSDGRVIHCASKDGPAACLIASKVDRVAIENPADGAILGEWSHW